MRHSIKKKSRPTALNNRNRECNQGFTLVEVLCALAILLVIIVPFYRFSLQTVSLQKRSEIQISANHIAQGEMERLRNKSVLKEGESAYENHSGTNNFYVVSRVEKIGTVISDPGQGQQSWHIKLIFDETTLPVEGNAARVSITGRDGSNYGTVYAKTVLPHTGLICTINSNNTIDFSGINSLTLSSNVVSRLGLDFIQPGGELDLAIACTGDLSISLDFYLASSYLHPSLPKYNVTVQNDVGRLKVKKWPGAARDLKLREVLYTGGNQSYLEALSYLINVRVYESKTHYDVGEQELIGLSSVTSRFGTKADDGS